MRKKTLTRRQFLEKTSAGLAVASVVPLVAPVSANPNALALRGGTPVRTTPFPAWPQTGDLDEKNILKARCYEASGRGFRPIIRLTGGHV